MARVPDVPCTICGGLMVRVPTSAPPELMAHRRCRAARLRESAGDPPAECGACARPFESRLRSDGRWVQTCTKSCAQRLRLVQGEHAWQKAPRYGAWTDGGDPSRDVLRGERSRRARRARKRRVESEPYTTMEIAERDGWRCGVCRRKVRSDLEWPHPRSASVDHIVPLSRGGDDTRANVRLAHLRCNLSLGNRTEWGQQLLIG